MSRPAYYNEIDPYCCQWLREAIAAGLLPAGDVDERDIRLVQPADLRGYGQIHLFAGIGGGALACQLADLPDDFDILTAGPPCQPASLAGNRLGESDDRWLWPELFRLLGDRVLRQHYALVENPPGILTLGDGSGWAGILAALAEIGRDVEWSSVSAADVGASQGRERVWLVAYPDGARASQPQEPEGADATAVVGARARAAGGDRRGNAPARVCQPRGAPGGVADALAVAGRWGVQLGDLAGGLGGAPADDAGRGLQPERRTAEAPGGGGDGGARPVADANHGPRSSWAGRSTERDGAQEPGARDAGDAGREVANAHEDDDRRLHPGRPDEGRAAVAPGDGEAGCMADAPGRQREPERGGQSRGGTSERAGEGGEHRPAQSGLGRPAHGLPVYLGGDQWPAPPGAPQWEWEAPRLIESITPAGRKLLAALGNAWVPQSAVPALEIIRTHAGLAPWR